MKSTELRIGNLVYAINRRSEVHIPETLPMKIFQIGLFNSEVLSASENPAEATSWLKISNSDLSSIPLTHEWLLKFGFELRSQYDYWNYATPNNWFISMWMADHQVEGLETISEKGVCYYGENYIPVKYVHQLQNLYFALTGKELECNA